jgi:hypothetical protein
MLDIEDGLAKVDHQVTVLMRGTGQQTIFDTPQSGLWTKSTIVAPGCLVEVGQYRLRHVIERRGCWRERGGRRIGNARCRCWTFEVWRVRGYVRTPRRVVGCPAAAGGALVPAWRWEYTGRVRRRHAVNLPALYNLDPARYNQGSFVLYYHPRLGGHGSQTAKRKR